jgi:hypothetical protein
MHAQHQSLPCGATTGQPSGPGGKPESCRSIRLTPWDLSRAIIGRKAPCRAVLLTVDGHVTRNRQPEGAEYQRSIPCDSAFRSLLLQVLGKARPTGGLAGCGKANSALLKIKPALAAATWLFLAAPTALRSCRSVPLTSFANEVVRACRTRSVILWS